MKRKQAILFALLSIVLLTSAALAGDWTHKPAIGIRGPLFIPYDDRFGPEPYRIGLDGSLFFKYGITNGLVLGLSGGYISTYNDTTATEDANLKFMKKSKADTKLTGIALGLTGNYYFLPNSAVQPYVLAGVGVDMWKTKPKEGPGEEFNLTDLGVKGGLGVNFWLTDYLTLDVQGKVTYEVSNMSADNVPGVDMADFDNREFRGYLEPSIGLTYVIGKVKDTDNDGVNDKLDQCPDTPLGAQVDGDGCPLDDDGDGVFNGLDNCPNTPKGAIVDITGCPTDTDGDGVFDGIDACPNTPDGALVNQTGCPTDTDGDGVLDGLDKCADTQKGCRVDEAGCPLDGDGDGVCDGIDRCPTTPAGAKVKEDGCPVEVKAPVQKITLNIKYKTGSYEPDDNARQILDELIKTMKNYTGTKIQINGFTDDVGSDASNQVLSEKRAGGVRDYLLRGGVEAERMTIRGYGEDPQYFVGDNKTAQGKQQNRRVEIISIEQ
jgi:outer membrane protein OmpA-like peptidoglycan-associated protein/opacity protein-like surface antigen